MLLANIYMFDLMWTKKPWTARNLWFKNLVRFPVPLESSKLRRRLGLHFSKQQQNLKSHLKIIRPQKGTFKKESIKWRQQTIFARFLQKFTIMLYFHLKRPKYSFSRNFILLVKVYSNQIILKQNLKRTMNVSYTPFFIKNLAQGLVL